LIAAAAIWASTVEMAIPLARHFFADLRGIDVVASMKGKKGEWRQMVCQPPRSFGTWKALKDLLEDDSRQHHLPAFDSTTQGIDLAAGGAVSPQGQRPDRGVHEQAHLRSRSFL
jgi:hypothetical protein